MKKSIGAGTFAVPAPVWIVGSYDKDGKPNGMTAAWGGICCSKPPCVYVSLQTVRYTYENLMARKAYTISVPSEDYAKEADYFGMVSGRREDKFKAAGLTPVASEIVDAPYVSEFPLVLECRVVQAIDLGLHTQFVGEVLDVKVDEDKLGEGGGLDIEKIRPLIFTPGAMTYHGVGPSVERAFSVGRALMKDGA